MSNRTKNWLTVPIMLIGMLFLVLTHTSFGIVLVYGIFTGITILLAYMIDNLEQKMDDKIREAIKVGLGVELKYETTKMLQAAEAELIKQPNNLKVQAIHRLALERLERILRVEKEIQNENQISE